MNVKITSLSIACALALAACGGDNTPPAQDTGTPAATPATDAQPVDTATAPAATPMQPAGQSTPPQTTPDATAAPATDTAAADGKPEAVVNNCSTTIEGNDAMQFDVGSITVPSSCSEFTINLKHVGKLPVAAMGHNVVISQASDRAGIAADGMSAGADGGYVKPDDARVIAHSDMVGGGQSTSVTFPVSAIQGAGPFEFFCSFPGHWAVMRGPIKVG